MNCTNKKSLLILTGPTAVGKTKLSIELAKQLNGEIVSADSMQVYRGMDIGSAKITEDEMEGVRHHLIDVLDPIEPFHVVRFQQMAKQAIHEIYERGNLPIITGGTGFYIQALLYDIDFEDTCEDSEYRQYLEKLISEKGKEYLHNMLTEVDQQAASEIHYSNSKRVIRALEYYKLTGRKISEHNKEQKERKSPYQFAYFVLNRPREILYERINKRVDIMMENGLLDEVKKLKDQGCKREYVSMQGIGYKELLAYLDDEYTLDEAVEKIKQDTRHFAKRQLTWFRRERDVTWIDAEGLSDKQLLANTLELWNKTQRGE